MIAQGIDGQKVTADFRRKEFIEAQPQEELECIAKKLETGDAEVQVDGRSFTLTKGLAVFERKKEKAGLAALTSLQSSVHFSTFPVEAQGMIR